MANWSKNLIEQQWVNNTIDLYQWRPYNFDEVIINGLFFNDDISNKLNISITCSDTLSLSDIVSTYTNYTGTHMGSCKLDTVAFSGFVTVQANVSSNALFFVDSSNGISDSILNVSAFSDDTSDLKADVTYFTE